MFKIFITPRLVTYPNDSLKNLKKCQMDETNINTILGVTWTGFVI